VNAGGGLRPLEMDACRGPGDGATALRAEGGGVVEEEEGEALLVEDVPAPWQRAGVVLEEGFHAQDAIGILWVGVVRIQRPLPAATPAAAGGALRGR
jgi:hypothetical protein